MKNYIQVKEFSPLYICFAYIDVPEYYADELFNKYKVHVAFDAEYAHPEYGYRVITCRVYRWERKRFRMAMNELVDVMMQNGKHDYLKFSNDLFHGLKKDLTR